MIDFLRPIEAFANKKTLQKVREIRYNFYEEKRKGNFLVEVCLILARADNHCEEAKRQDHQTLGRRQRCRIETCNAKYGLAHIRVTVFELKPIIL